MVYKEHGGNPPPQMEIEMMNTVLYVTKCNVADTDISEEYAAVVIRVEESGTYLSHMVLP